MKIYQPIVIKKTLEIIDILIESKFFEDYEMESTDFAMRYISDKLTEKFINGEIDLEQDELFTEDELEKCLSDIVIGTLMYQLKEKGLINSYEDEQTEETFFLTEEGKEFLKKLKEE